MSPLAASSAPSLAASAAEPNTYGALIVMLILSAVLVLLIRSMNGHLRKVPKQWEDEPPTPPQDRPDAAAS